MPFINSAPLYRDQDIILGDDGNIVVSYNDIESEILQRLTAIRGTSPFLEDYGSRIYTLQNERISINTGESHSFVKEALQPMVISGRIKDDLIVNIVMNGNLLNIIVKVTAVAGGIITANYTTFLR